MNRFVTFTAREKAGLIALLVLLLAFVAIRATLSLWVRPATNTAEQARLNQAWTTYRNSQPLPIPPADTATAAYTDAGYTGHMPTIININTADSATLVQLKGIGPATAAKIVSIRTRYGPYKNTAQLVEVKAIPRAAYELLKAHLSVSDSL